MKKNRRGQALVEFALGLPLLLLLLAGGTGVSLALYASSQMDNAAFAGALTGARTDPGSIYTITSGGCPSTVVNAVDQAVSQSLTGSSGSNSSIGGVVPIQRIVGNSFQGVTVSCPYGFNRSQTSATNGGTTTGDNMPATIIVTVHAQANLLVVFAPLFNPTINISETANDEILPYRSRS